MAKSVCSGSLFCALLLPGYLSAQVPPAEVTGPVAAAAHGDPGRNNQLNPNAIVVPGVEYIEQEYFIEGLANRYSTPELQAGEILDSGHPYKSRFVVRRPDDALSYDIFSAVATQPSL
jgi:hypothetical protein